MIKQNEVFYFGGCSFYMALPKASYVLSFLLPFRMKLKVKLVQLLALNSNKVAIH